MPPCIDLIGKTFGRLVVVERAAKRTKHRGAEWLCRCSCGNFSIVHSNNLRSDSDSDRGTASCGCVRTLKHGQGKKKRPEYGVWCSMIQRCTNPKRNNWRWYGAKGIKVCDRWRLSFDSFFSDMGPRPKGHSIDRIDSDLHYEPGNCRWATAKEQTANRRLSSRNLDKSVPGRRQLEVPASL